MTKSPFVSHVSLTPGRGFGLSSPSRRKTKNTWWFQGLAVFPSCSAPFRRHGGSLLGMTNGIFSSPIIMPTYDVNLFVFFLWCQFCHLSSCIFFICYVPCECVVIVIYVYLLLLLYWDIEWEHIWDYHHSPSIQKSFAGLTRTKMDRNWKPTKHVELKQRVFDMTWLS